LALLSFIFWLIIFLFAFFCQALTNIPLKTIVPNGGGKVIAVFDSINHEQKSPGIYTYADYDPQKPKPNADLVVFDEYSGTNDLNVMVGDQIEMLLNAENHKGDLFLLSWTLTQSGGQVIFCYFCQKNKCDPNCLQQCKLGACDSIMELAEKANSVLASKLMPYFKPGKTTPIPNIIYIDDVDCSVTALSIRLNRILLQRN